ncbi:MAG: ribonuclease HII [Dehalococcoidia bacterium]|nr:ribonuclease HII [Dehalococcoidia bacterium]
MMQQSGYKLIAGIDEVGRGCLAGPVVAAAVILPQNMDAPWLTEVRDSKMLKVKQRERLFTSIRETAIAIGVGAVQHDKIDSIGIATATKLAMMQAVGQLQPVADFLLIDYVKLDQLPIPQKSIIHGDALCYSIACASIMAKVTRDNMMNILDELHPDFGFKRHKGYGTPEHKRNIEKYGLSPIHRRSFCNFQYRFDISE